MKKILTLFKRGEDFKVIDEVNPECQWVLDGDGKATQKIDGTCCMIRDGKLYRRYELKDGRDMPDEFELAGPLVNGKQPGWVPVAEDDPSNKWHFQAFKALDPYALKKGDLDGTYELIGPKIQGNPEGTNNHFLISHGSNVLMRRELKLGIRTFESIKRFLQDLDIEGIVFHHSDGRMAKIKKKDFGLPRKPVE